MDTRLLKPETSALLIVDVQAKLMPAIENGARVLDRVRILAAGAAKLGVPVVVSEQYPKGLGPTSPEVLAALPAGALVLAKTAFGCLADPALRDALERLGRKQVVVCGVEAHVCVNQTVQQLLEAGYQPHLAADAIGSRTAADRDCGLQKTLGAGALPSTVETALFEWLGDAKHPEFKAVQALVK